MHQQDPSLKKANQTPGTMSYLEASSLITTRIAEIASNPDTARGNSDPVLIEASTGGMLRLLASEQGAKAIQALEDNQDDPFSRELNKQMQMGVFDMGLFIRNELGLNVDEITDPNKPLPDRLRAAQSIIGNRTLRNPDPQYRRTLANAGQSLVFGTMALVNKGLIDPTEAKAKDELDRLMGFYNQSVRHNSLEASLGLIPVEQVKKTSELIPEREAVSELPYVTLGRRYPLGVVVSRSGGALDAGWTPVAEGRGVGVNGEEVLLISNAKIIVVYKKGAGYKPLPADQLAELQTTPDAIAIANKYQQEVKQLAIENSKALVGEALGGLDLDPKLELQSQYDAILDSLAPQERADLFFYTNEQRRLVRIDTINGKNQRLYQEVYGSVSDKKAKLSDKALEASRLQEQLGMIL